MAVDSPNHSQRVYEQPPLKGCAGETVTQHLAEEEGEVEAHLTSFVFREGSRSACNAVVDVGRR